MINALMMARVIGRVMVTRQPTPGWLSISTMPETAAMLFLTTSIPTPRPEMSLTLSLVEKPGRKSRSRASRSETASTAEINPFSNALRFTLSSSIPLPSSSTSMTTWLPFWKEDSLMVPLSSFPCRTRSSGVSIPWSMEFLMMCIISDPMMHIIRNSMVDGVSDDVHHRVRDILDDQLVQFGVGAEHLQFDLFPLFPGNLPDNPGHLLEQLSNGDHPDLHDPFLQLVQFTVEPLRRLQKLQCQRGKTVTLHPEGKLGDRRVAEDQLPHDIHQLIELGDIDPHRLAEALGSQRGIIAGRRRRLRRIGGGHLRRNIEPGDGDILPFHHGGDFIDALFGTVQYFKIYGEPQPSSRTREGADDFPCLFQNLRQFPQVLIEGCQVERGADRINLASLLGVLQEPVLFVLGQGVKDLFRNPEPGQW